MSSQRPQDASVATDADPAADDRPSTDDIARRGTVRHGDASGDGSTSGASTEPAHPEASDRTPLFPTEQSQELRSRWGSIQVGFVDEPRAAVEQADSLVAEVMQTLATTFSRERSSLEGQWGKGEDVSTEDLRQTLRRYRSFFDRLLSL